jgi:PIN domain nuclease of toxin-antitoxin system
MDNLFVLDTHPLIYYATNKLSKLGKRTRRIFQEFEGGQVYFHVPAPVIIETWLLVKNGKLRVSTSFKTWWHRLASPALIQVELNWQDVVTASELNWDHPDIFDRLIVATALRLDLPLVTKDSAISAWGGIEVVW